MGLTPEQPDYPFALKIDPDRQLYPSYRSKATHVTFSHGGRLLGMDLEYSPSTKEPYMVSLATSPKFILSTSYSEKMDGILKRLYALDDIKWIGHNILSADCDALELTKGFPHVPAGGVIDTLLAYYAMNQHLCHGNQERDEDDDRLSWGRGPGRLGLHSMASRYLLWAEYKTCRGDACSGPCPTHNEYWYNALDAYAPVECWHEMRAEARGIRL